MTYKTGTQLQFDEELKVKPTTLDVIKASAIFLGLYTALYLLIALCQTIGSK